jgi:predicted HTH domain antitoxin
MNLVCELPVGVSENEAKLLLAIKLYEINKISLEKAAKLAGYSKSAFMEVLEQYQIPIFNYSADELREEVITRSKLKVIKSKKIDILEVANDYGASNIRYVIEDKEVIFVINLDKDRSLFDLGGLLASLRELLRFNVVVFTESMIKEQYRESIINNAVKL